MPGFELALKGLYLWCRVHTVLFIESVQVQSAEWGNKTREERQILYAMNPDLAPLFY